MYIYQAGMPFNLKTFTPAPLCVLHRTSLGASPGRVSPIHLQPLLTFESPHFNIIFVPLHSL